MFAVLFFIISVSAIFFTIVLSFVQLFNKKEQEWKAFYQSLPILSFLLVMYIFNVLFGQGETIVYILLAMLVVPAFYMIHAVLGIIGLCISIKKGNVLSMKEGYPLLFVTSVLTFVSFIVPIVIFLSFLLSCSIIVMNKMKAKAK
ncbi:hypothetical protein BAMA_20310 [Bacillus manliponensis]|uniref:Uncharacterized protein n=1 Tax=Bacillus manliponensis TaxID=574376 RepID=A0A073JZD3_9BACI|nr:hypothetical protein [Bacillus manliponensis]KEK19615.1 hypothetical protein BAMA_20310 [Bacillus manliponensis]